MAKKTQKSKSARLVSSRGQQSLGWLISNPWRTIVLVGVVVLVSFVGVHQYNVIEAATIEQEAHDICGAYGEKASPTTAECIADKVLIDNFYSRWDGQTPDQKNCLKNLWNGESGWRWNAQNPTSPAYGIPQSDPGYKMASAYNNPKYGTWQDNVVTQERWGLDYISSVYGNPCTAWNDWLSRNPHWY